MAVQTAAASNSDVAQVNNYDDDVFGCTDSEMFVVPYYNNKKRIKKSTQNARKRRNVFTSSPTILLFKIFAVIFIIYVALATYAVAGETRSTTYATPLTTLIAPPGSPYHYHECGSIDIRHRCEYFSQLDNCTVVTGYLIILLFSNGQPCDYSKYRFPHLREVTDFMLIHDNDDVTSLRNVFPNLTVIRGRRLFLNYAVGISDTSELTAIEFPSLIALQRGHVFIAHNKMACYLDTINFDRLTLTAGENQIISENQTQCVKNEKPCQGCDSGYCWSNRVCQKFENDNILNLKQSIQHCDIQCLGGCDNRTAQGCAVCRSWSDHGFCVAKCPEDKYASEHFLRCYTREECTVAKRLFIYKNECVAECPYGYTANNATKECDSCGGINGCGKVCDPPEFREQFEIFALSDVERLRGCRVLKGNVDIFFAYRVNVQELIDVFKTVREITGFLKVHDSPHLLTLNFFENLEKIHGETLEHGHYSLVLYNNAKLEEIWPLKYNLELVHGGIYIYLNDRLCNRVIRTFKNNVKHDHSLDSIHRSDVEVLCFPEKLLVATEALSHRSFKLTWTKDQTADEVEIIYQPVVAKKPGVLEQNKLDIPICERIHWQRELIFSIDLMENDTHNFFVVDNLEPHTHYRYLVKTFSREDLYAARSEMKDIVTLPDIPPPPVLEIYKKSFESLSVQWYYENLEDPSVDFYRLEVYEMPDKQEIIDQRDYCEDPSIPYSDFHNEDYDDCCSRRLEDRMDASYKNQIRQEFACTLNQKQYCERSSLRDTNDNNVNSLLIKRLERRESNYTIRSLARYSAYTIQIQACNHAGCGSFNIIADRTNYSLAADRIYDLTACKMTHNNKFRVRFKEPNKPNGAIISYALHFRFLDSTKGPYLSHMHCRTRLEHKRDNYLFVAHLNETFNQVGVRVESLGHRTFSGWVDVTNCDKSTGEAGHTLMYYIVILISVVLLVGLCTSIYCYRRQVWFTMSQRLRRYMPSGRTLGNLLNPDPDGDRQILVEDFDRVRFLNTPDENEVY